MAAVSDSLTLREIVESSDFPAAIKAIERLTTESANKDAVLIDIASQSKSDEFGDDREDADFEGAYDIMIQLARSVTDKQEQDDGHADH